MRLMLMLIVLAGPACAQAQNVGDLSPNPNNNNTSGNPFSPGGSWSLSRQGNPNIGRAAPTSPYAWSNVAPVLGPLPAFDRGMSFPLLAPPTASPNVPGNNPGPYGITLPPNHPLGFGTR